MSNHTRRSDANTQNNGVPDKNGKDHWVDELRVSKPMSFALASHMQYKYGMKPTLNVDSIKLMRSSLEKSLRKYQLRGLKLFRILSSEEWISCDLSDEMVLKGIRPLKIPKHSSLVRDTNLAMLSYRLYEEFGEGRIYFGSSRRSSDPECGIWVFNRSLEIPGDYLFLSSLLWRQQYVRVFYILHTTELPRIIKSIKGGSAWNEWVGTLPEAVFRETIEVDLIVDGMEDDGLEGMAVEGGLEGV